MPRAGYAQSQKELADLYFKLIQRGGIWKSGGLRTVIKKLRKHNFVASRDRLTDQGAMLRYVPDKSSTLKPLKYQGLSYDKLRRLIPGTPEYKRIAERHRKKPSRLKRMTPGTPEYESRLKYQREYNKTYSDNADRSAYLRRYYQQNRHRILQNAKNRYRRRKGIK